MYIYVLYANLKKLKTTIKIWSKKSSVVVNVHKFNKEKEKKMKTERRLGKAGTHTEAEKPSQAWDQPGLHSKF